MGFEVGFFDIEATNLDANRGHILCAAVKVSGIKQPYIARIDEFADFKDRMWYDKTICQDIAEALAGLDMVVTQYGSRYDIPFVNSRLLYHKLPPLAPLMHCDIWRIARTHLALSSNRLETMSLFLHTKANKDHLDWETWERAAYGDKVSLDAIVDHCRRDVLVLEEIFEALKPFIKQIRR